MHRWRSTPVRFAACDAELRKAAEAVLHEGESLSSFMEQSLRDEVNRRRMQAEFIARGLAARDEARRTGVCYDADTVHDNCATCSPKPRPKRSPGRELARPLYTRGARRSRETVRLSAGAGHGVRFGACWRRSSRARNCCGGFLAAAASLIGTIPCCVNFPCRLATRAMCFCTRSRMTPPLPSSPCAASAKTTITETRVG